MTISGGIVCLFRQLCLIIDPSQYIRLSRVQKRNTGIFEATLCGILPILRMILSYVVQPDRYWIFGTYGCTPTVDTSWPSYALVLVWPLVADLGALWYGALATLQMVKHSREVSKLLPGGQVTASKRRTERLLVMTVLLIILEALTRAVVFWGEIMPFLVPYSWSRIHPPNWSRKIEKASFRPIHLAVYGRSIAHSIIIFGFLGCSAEAIAVYKVWLGRSRSRLWWTSMIKQPQASNKKAKVPSKSSDPGQTRDFGHELATT